jgi:hypothetical protein
MPRRPKADKQKTTASSVEPATPETDGDGLALAKSFDPSSGPDLDEREQRQSGQRKAAGPGRRRVRGAAAPKAFSGSDEELADVVESWGSDPCTTQSVDPETP